MSSITSNRWILGGGLTTIVGLVMLGVGLFSEPKQDNNHKEYPPQQQEPDVRDVVEVEEDYDDEYEDYDYEDDEEYEDDDYEYQY